MAFYKKMLSTKHKEGNLQPKGSTFQVWKVLLYLIQGTLIHVYNPRTVLHGLVQRLAFFIYCCNFVTVTKWTNYIIRMSDVFRSLYSLLILMYYKFIYTYVVFYNNIIVGEL